MFIYSLSVSDAQDVERSEKKKFKAAKKDNNAHEEVAFVFMLTLNGASTLCF